MIRLTFITGAHGVGKTILAGALAKQYQAWGRKAFVASESNAMLGDWSTAKDIQKIRDENRDEHWCIDCFTELPPDLDLKSGDVVIHMERVQ